MAAALPFVLAFAGTALAGALNSGKPGAQGPSAAEIAAQKRLDDIEDKRAAREEASGKRRSEILAERAAGPQTLFTRSGTIPLPVKLGGGRP